MTPLGDPEPDVTFYKGGLPIEKKKNLKYRTDWDPTSDTYTLVIKNAGLEDMGVYTVKAKNDKGETSSNATIRFGDWPVESFEDPYVKLNIIDVTTSESGSDTDDDIVDSTKKKLAQLIEEDLDLSIIEERSEHSEAMEDSLSEDSLSEDTYAPRIEIVPEPVCVNEGETIRLATKVTGQKVMVISQTSSQRSWLFASHPALAQYRPCVFILFFVTSSIILLSCTFVVRSCNINNRYSSSHVQM